jgi:aspartate racemase
MKLIGLLGGMSWESTAVYYRLMNEAVREKLGALHSARVLIHSVDFQEIERCQHRGDWNEAGRLLGIAAQSLKAGGADFLVMATNTMHKVAAEIEAASGLQLLHIADPTGEALVKAGVKRVSLLGTRFTMEQEFYRNRLAQKFGLEVVTPESAERDLVHNIIYQELCLGITKPQSAGAYSAIIAKQKALDAEAVILGCTEITMIINQENSALPVFDTTELHAKAAVERALG